MKTKLSFLALILFSLIFSPQAQSQQVSIIGTWRNTPFRVTMVINQNGTYTFSGPQGTSQGRWGAQGFQFTMMEATGRVIPYRVMALTQTTLQLVDAYGAQLVYQRVGGGVSGGAGTAPPKASKGGAGGGGDKVLATAKDFKLMKSHIDAAKGLAEFVTGMPLPQKEINELTTSAKREFKQMPKTFVNEMKGLKANLDKLHSLKKPEQVAAARLQLTAALWKGIKNLPQSKRPLLARIIFRHVRVLAEDVKNNLVLTDRDLNAMVEYLAFCHQLYNEMFYQKTPVTTGQMAKFKMDAVKYFAQIPLERKQFMCSATVTWTMLKANYNRLGAFQQGQVKGQIAAKFPDTVMPPKQRPTSSSGYNSRYTKSGRKKSLAEMQREFQAKQNCFTIMNNMSLQNHATMLNTIENFGGTGNYWEVK